ncbi:branched-chain amino acid ABC transporter permease [Deinococcus pimensis]|uniref:branched-chain amino acid ABC transporter permease n=1 Tax=Deinococcus pimensis TaxID=309888 RepID=UPI00047F0BD8|nr:branched-chain amino acid ABC transporter permease [Deinococcus pimensis]
MELGIVAFVLTNVLVKGLLVGFVYAIIALGYTMVYGVLQLINFAHSEVFITGGVVGFEVFRILGPSPMNGYLKLAIALIAAMIVAGFLNVLIERLAYRPLRNAPRLVPLISAIGVSLVLQDVIRFLEGLAGRFNLVYVLPDVFTQRAFGVPVPFSTAIVPVQGKDVIVIVVAILMLVGLTYLVNYTRLGRAIRAVAQDRTTSGLMGIDANRIISLTFLIGGALGGVGGVLFGIFFSKVDPYAGTIPGIKAFTAAVLGGIGSIPGAVLGGLVLGLLENLIGVLNVFAQVPALGFLKSIGAEYKDIGAFIALILILIFRPAGLLGRNTTEKV